MRPQQRFVDHPTRPRRFDGYALLLIAALLLGAFAGIATAPDDERLGGDFVAFYGAGRTAIEEGWTDLYDPVTQSAVQSAITPGDGFLYFAYPPFFAVPYTAAALLPFRLALAMHVLVMSGAVVAAVAMLRRLTDVPSIPIATAVALTFGPLGASVLGGQNVALTAALFVATALLESQGHERSAGFVAAMTFFKPQFGLPLAGLLLLLRRRRLVTGWFLGALTLWSANTVLLGPGWVDGWTEHLPWFADENLATSGDLFVSLPGVATQLLPEPLSGLMGYGLAIGVAGAVVAVWLRFTDDLALRYAAVGAGIVLLAPQALFYAAALSFLAVAWVSSAHRLGPKPVAAVWFGGLLVFVRQIGPVSPVFLVTLGAFVWVLWRSRVALRSAA